MRRWTDGKSWSASRVSGSFLTYREMEGKRGGSFPSQPQAKRPSGKSPDGSATGDSEGEGPDGYRYKPGETCTFSTTTTFELSNVKIDGLMKQSFSITTSSGQHLHLISYFSRAHTQAANLQTPTTDAQLRHIRPPKNMYPESSVNENTNVPAVTRGPMPGSPYAPAPQQMGSQSPYSRPTHSPHMPVMVYHAHGPPTPPYQAAYYIPGHPSPVYHPQGPFFYGYAPPPPPGHTTHLDRLPPQLSNPHLPPSHPGFQSHPPYQPAPQYVAHPPARAMQATELAQQQAQVNGQQVMHHQTPTSSASLPEQGPVLPALNGIGKPSTPQPSEVKSNEALNVPDTNGASQNSAPSPGRTIPNIKTLLNNHSTENNAETNQSNSRSGSRSPGNTQRPPREMLLASANSSAADTSAISKLNSAFL